jgi:hypothetical protein
MFIGLTNRAFTHKFVDVNAHSLSVEIRLGLVYGLVIPGMTCGRVNVDKL